MSDVSDVDLEVAGLDGGDEVENTRRAMVAADAGLRVKVRLRACGTQRGISVVDLISSMDSREVMLKIFTCEMSAW